VTDTGSGKKADAARDHDFGDIPCPFCAGGRTSVMSLFGGNAGEVLMHCGDCRTVFHWVKWQGKLPAHSIDAA